MFRAQRFLYDHLEERQWRVEADQLCSADTFNNQRAALLLSDIVRVSRSSALIDVARQVRAKFYASPDAFLRDVNRRRFEAVRQELNKKADVPFGRRSAPLSILLASEDVRSRGLLGLPPTGDLLASDIRQAFRIAARSAHPDAGGDAGQFSRLISARDLLLKDF